MNALLENLANFATALALLVLAFQLWRESRLGSAARDRETQLELGVRYADFLKLAIERPELELFDTLKPDEIGTPTSETTQRQKLAAFQLLASIFEDAHYLFGGEESDLRTEAWRGWVRYIDYWASRPDFSRAWQEQLSLDFNDRFMEFMSRRNFPVRG
jgi:hypothetical protein